MNASASYVNLYEEDFIAVKIKGNSITTERQSIHLIFLIDVSDSMTETDGQGKESKLEHVKQSILFLLPLLLPTDSLSLITFGDDATIQIENQFATTEGKTLLEHTISQLHTDGCTNMSAGLLTMREVAQRAASESQKQGVLLLTDGLANMGISSRVDLLTMTNELLSFTPGLTLTTIGYGIHHDAQLLRDLAGIGSGSYNIVLSRDHIASVVGDVFGGLTSVVAQMVTLTLPIGYVPRTKYIWKPSQRKIQIGDIYAENDIIILIKPIDSESTTSIQVEGVAMPSLEMIRLDLVPIAHDSSVDGLKDIYLAYFRYEVSEVLVQYKSESSRAKAAVLQTKLQALPYADSLLVQMMLDDLDHVLHPSSHSQADATLLQHSVYLSLGRGLRSDIGEEQQDPATISSRARSNALNTIGSPFSNRIQLRATQSMREASQTI